MCVCVRALMKFFSSPHLCDHLSHPLLCCLEPTVIDADHQKKYCRLMQVQTKDVDLIVIERRIASLK